MLHCCLNCPFWLHENQTKCCQNLQLNVLFSGSWKIRFHRLEPKPNRINRTRNSSVPHFQSNRSVSSSQVTELAEEPNRSVSVNRTHRLTSVCPRPDQKSQLFGLKFSCPRLSHGYCKTSSFGLGFSFFFELRWLEKIPGLVCSNQTCPHKRHGPGQVYIYYVARQSDGGCVP